MLTSRQALLHYLTLFGVLSSIVQVFVFYFLTSNLWLCGVSILATFLFIIINITNVSKGHELVKLAFFIVAPASLVMWSIFLPQGVGIPVFFLPLSVIMIRLFEFGQVNWIYRLSILFCALGVTFSLNFEGDFITYSLLKDAELRSARLSIIINLLLVIFTIHHIIKDVREEDASLFESKEKLMAIYNSLTDAMFFIDKNEVVKWYNQSAAMEFVHAFSLELKAGKKFSSFLSEDYQPKFAISFQDALNGIIATNNHVYIKSNLQKLYFEYLYVPVFDKNDTIIGVSLSLKNITRRSIVEDELMQQKFMLEEVYNQSPDALFLISVKTQKVISYNQTAHFLFHLDKDSSFVSYKQLFDVPNKVDFWKQIEENLSVHGHDTFEANCKTEAGSEFIGGTYLKRFDVNGVSHLLIRISDITDKVQQREYKMALLDMKRQHSENMLRQKNLGMLVHGQELERQRISKELHDGIGQMLTAIRLQVSSMDMQDLEDDRKLANEMIDSTIMEVKRISNNLMPSAIVDLGLIPALESLFTKVPSTIVAKFDYDHFVMEIGLTKKQEIAIYRILQEALNNTLKYANATLVNISIKFQNVDYITVNYIDNGKGFSIDNNLTNFGLQTLGNGLLNMRERAEMIGASFFIQSQQTKGVTINVQIPINNIEIDGQD
jgi:signal transduction histidine kinase